MENVKKLRAMTGSGILDCKKALEESNGDMDLAVEYLRKKGLSKAAKKVGRATNEGILSLYISEDKKSFGVIGLYCETDFVGKNEGFKNEANTLSRKAAESGAKTAEELLNVSLDDNNVDYRVKMTSAKFGENIQLGSALSGKTNDSFVGYLHSNEKLVVIVEFSGSNEEAAKNIAMHIAALNPMFLDKSSVSSDYIAKEEDIVRAELENSGKPANVIDMIVKGKIDKIYENVSLLSQKYVKSGDMTVEEYANKSGIKVLSFNRVVLGE